MEDAHIDELLRWYRALSRAVVPDCPAGIHPYVCKLEVFAIFSRAVESQEQGDFRQALKCVYEIRCPLLEAKQVRILVPTLIQYPKSQTLHLQKSESSIKTHPHQLFQIQLC